jgi:hypothetical protein
MVKKWCLFLIAVMLIQPAAAMSDSDSNEKKPKTKKVSILMVIPGLQQLKSGKYVKGSLLLGSFIGSVTGAFVYNKKGSDWYDKYLKSTDVEEIILLRQSTEKNLKKRNLFIAGILTVWLVHIIDLKFFKSGKGGVKGEMGKNKFNISFYYSFR